MKHKKKYLPSVLFRSIMGRAVRGMKHSKRGYSCIANLTSDLDDAAHCVATFGFWTYLGDLMHTSKSGYNEHVKIPYCQACYPGDMRIMWTGYYPTWHDADNADANEEYKANASFIESMYEAIVSSMFKTAKHHDVLMYYTLDWYVKLLDAGSTLEQHIMQADLDNKDLTNPEAYPWLIY